MTPNPIRNKHRKPRNRINGWLVIDKQPGMTSTDVVTAVKRLLHPEKIGHAGTLDPLATGVLPLALGEATKTVMFLQDSQKKYAYTASWGEERDTDDAEGQVTQRSNARPARADIEALFPKFLGEIQQTPPAYSAVKIQGQRAYALARGGEAVELSARPVQIHDIQIYPSPPSLSLPQNGGGDKMESTQFTVTCGKGTYVRALARDMGRELGCLGYISQLRRTGVGVFSEEHAISLDKLSEIVHLAQPLPLWPVASVLDDIPALDVGPENARKLKSGVSLPLPEGMVVTHPIASVQSGGKLIALVSLDAGWMKPTRLFNT